MFAWKQIVVALLPWHFFTPLGREGDVLGKTTLILDLMGVRSKVRFPLQWLHNLFLLILILKLCWVTNSQLRDSCLSNSWRNCFDSATNGIQKLSEVASGFRNFTLFWEHEARECHTVSVYRRSHDQPVVPTVNEQEILLVIINNAL